MVTVTLNSIPTPPVVVYPDADGAKLTAGILLITKPGLHTMAGPLTVGIVPLSQISHVEITEPAAPPAA